MIGTVVGNYKVLEKIGEGGMGAVFKGVDLMLEREVAIKVLKPELASQPQVVERFRSEAVTLAKLNHPNIATLFSFFRQGDHFFMVLEYVNGTPIDKIIEAHGLMTCEQAIPLFSQMLEGIDHAHALGIIHRDIKPANMMLTENGLLKVLDFGIARALGSARMTRAGHLIGTIEYMSPEQVRGMDTDARSDIYSLGMVLYEMLTGRVPFASDSEFELMKAQVEQLPPPPREFAPNIPEQVEWAILCATEKDPGKRFQTAGAFSEAIIDCVERAVATGELSKIDIRRATGRLNSSLVARNLATSRLSTGSLPTLSQPEDSTSTLDPSAETQRFPPPTRIADSLETARMPVPIASAIKPTRLGTPMDLPNISVANASRPAPQESFFSLKRFSRPYYILGIAAGGVIVFVIAIALSLFLMRERIRGGQGSSSPSVPVSSTSPEAKPSQDTDKGNETISPRDQPEVNHTSDRSQADNNNERTQVRDAIPKSTPASRASKSAKNDSASRDRARRAREALDKP